MKHLCLAGLIKAIGVSLIFAASSASQAAACPSVSDANLVNCGFDSDLTSGNWDPSGSSERRVTPVRNGSGSLRAAGDAASPTSASDGGVAQDDLDGNTIGYDLEFFLRFGTLTTVDPTTALVKVFVNGSELTNIVAGTPESDNDGGWTPFTGQIGPVSNGWVLSFTFTDPGNDDLFMDDVTLTARTGTGIPEPGSLLLVGVALASVALVRRRARQ
jgi:PEP-CTERM motif